MNSIAELSESLKAIGYDGKFLEGNVLDDAVIAGPKSEAFRELVTWIAFELHALRKTDEKVAKETDYNEFMLEISALLKELGCPYTQFVAGPLTGRLQTKESRILLLDYLISELMAMKMCLKLKPQENSYVIPVFESTTAKALETITKDLNLGKPPENISPKSLFEKIASKLDESIKKANPKKLSKPLFKAAQVMTDQQWDNLATLQRQLDDEYNLRRNMLLTRLEVTVQSFQWSEKMKGREDDIVKKYQKKRQMLDQLQYGEKDTDLAALLAAREDLAIIEKTSNAYVRKNTGTKIQKHVIGKVPDRGGRAYEHAPPPPEMPSWQQNRSAGPAGRGGGGGQRGGGGYRGGGRGGNNQNNWNQQQQSGQYQGNQGGFGQNNRDNQYSGGGGRVQGGWSQRGEKGSYNQGQRDTSGYAADYGDNTYTGSRGGYQNYGRGGGRGGNGGGNHYGGNSDRGGNFRGRSNYNRGGGNRR